MGQALVSNITVPLVFVVILKALAIARLSAVASLLAILPLSLSQFCPLVPYYYNPFPDWHPTANHRLAPYCSRLAGIPSARWLQSPLYPPRSRYFSSVIPSRGFALPLWLPQTPWGNRCNYRRGCLFRFVVDPLLQWFSFMPGHPCLPQARVSRP